MITQTMNWVLPGGASVMLTYQSPTGEPTAEHFVAIAAYLEVWAGGLGVLTSLRQEQAALLQEVQNIMSIVDDIKAQIANLESDVAEQTEVTASVLSLIEGLKTQLAEALVTASTLPELQARLTAINEGLDASRTQLANAVLANTAATDEDVVEEPLPIATEEPTPVEPPVEG